MPSDHETAREQQVEALAKVIERYESLGRRGLARQILDSPAMRDLLAEAKAEAGRDLRDYRAAYHRFVALAEQYDDDAAREPYGGEPWTTTAAAIRAAIDGDPTPYRTTEASDD